MAAVLVKGGQILHGTEFRFIAFISLSLASESNMVYSLFLINILFKCYFIEGQLISKGKFCCTAE